MSLFQQRPPAETIEDWHAHVYFDPGVTDAAARWLYAEIEARFDVEIGYWRERPQGPHTTAYFFVGFGAPLFADLVPWLAINRQGLRILVHPNTDRPRDDHLVHAIWLGGEQPLLGDTLAVHRAEPDRIDPAAIPPRATS